MKTLLSLPTVDNLFTVALITAVLFAQCFLLPIYFYASDASYQMNRTRNAAQIEYCETHHVGCFLMGIYFAPTPKTR